MKQDFVIAGIAIGDSDTYISVMQDGSIKNIPGLMDAECIPSAAAIKDSRYLSFGDDAFGCPQEDTVRISLHTLIREEQLAFDSCFVWSAEEVLAQFLKQQKSALRRCIGNVDRAIFSIPWDFGFDRTRILKNAADRAGLEAVRCVDETCLIALACYDRMQNDDETCRFFVFDIKSDCMEAGYFEADNGVLENIGVVGTHFQKGTSDAGVLNGALRKVFESLRDMGALANTGVDHPVIKNPEGTEQSIYAPRLFLTGDVRNHPELWEELKNLTGLEAQYVPFQYAARGAALQGAHLSGDQAAQDILFLDATRYSYWLQVEGHPAECVIRQAQLFPVRSSIDVKIQDEESRDGSLKVQIFQVPGNSLKDQADGKTYIIPVENPTAFSKGAVWGL